MILYKIKQDAKDPLLIHAFLPTDHLSLVAWVDASSQNRHDGYSTKGILVGMSTTELGEGKVACVSPMYWQSGRIDRVCRSPGSAEARAAVDAEDILFLLRYEWAEFLGFTPDNHCPDEHVNKTPGTLVTDSRNVYDRVLKPYITPKGAQRKIDIEMLALKEAQNHNCESSVS